MKIVTKIALFILAILIIIGLSFFTYYLIITSGMNLEKDRLLTPSDKIVFYNGNDEVAFVNNNDVSTTQFVDLPENLINAFISIEDKRFYKHNGIDYRSLIRASFKNLSTFSFKEGGSTISQQLIKNTHFTGEKTIKRKLCEIKLAKALEKNYSKNEIMEMYLNTIYFGNNCFGITNASKKYFDKKPIELNLSECAILAGVVKSPSNYSPVSNPEKCLLRRNLVLEEMKNQGYITNEDFESAKKLEVNKSDFSIGNDIQYYEQVKKELDFLSDKYDFDVNGVNVYTFYNENLQEQLKVIYNQGIESDAQAVITDKFSNVLAFESSCGAIKRQLGSTIKPILVYAPSIDLDEFDECSFINDEQTNFNGYVPKNYLDKYYGLVTLKESLSKSLNVPSVKILNQIGIENARKYLDKTTIKMTTNDNFLNLALGVTDVGYKLFDLNSVYASFINRGLYNSPSFIKKITSKTGKVLYEKQYQNTRLYGEDTAYVMNDMLKETAKTGTAKKLSALDFDVCAKTGTVGNENGNTDVYCVCYNGDITLSVWYGNANSSYLDNDILGGNAPTSACYKILSQIYTDNNPTNLFETDKIKKVKLDKISFDQNVIELADEIAPKRYVVEQNFKLSRVPTNKSTRFVNPKIDNAKLFVKNNEIVVQLCQAEYVNSIIYRQCNGEKLKIFDTNIENFNGKIIDDKITENTSYVYSIIPYFLNNDDAYYGEEIIIGQIKTPAKNAGADNWWIDDF